MRRFLLILLIFLLNNLFSQSKYYGKSEIEYIPGELFVKLTYDEFKLPLEIYGIKVSFSDVNSDLMRIDSVVTMNFKPNSRVIASEKTYELKSYSQKEPEIINRTQIRFNKNIVELFKKYGVFFIRRRAKTFSPADTLEHFINSRRKGLVKIKSPNYIKSLFIKFTKKSKTKEFLKELKNLGSVSHAQLSEKVMEFSVPNDTWYKKEGLQ